MSDNFDEIQLYIVGEYVFENKEDYEAALHERKAIQYLNTQLDLNNVKKVRDLYNEVIEKHVFVTPVGFDYLKKLRETVAAKDSSLLSEMKPIPILSTNHKRAGESEKYLSGKMENEIAKTNAALKKAREGRRTSIILNIILTVVVIAFFIIASSSSNPNILNYERVLQNKYASWAQELSDREEELNEKEHELNERTDGETAYNDTEQTEKQVIDYVEP